MNQTQRGSAVAMILGIGVAACGHSADDPPRTCEDCETGQKHHAITAVNTADKLIEAPPGLGHRLGQAVAIDNELAVVGAPRTSPGGHVVVWERVAGSWLRRHTFTGSDTLGNDLFGSAVAISGSTIVVGAPDADVGGTSRIGSAYVFERTGNAWFETQQLAAPDGASGDTFGFSVDIEENRIVVGAPLDDDGGSGSGSAYVFRRDATWVLDNTDHPTVAGKLVATDGRLVDQFGHAVGVSGNRIVIGAPRGGLANREGSAYGWELSGGTWSAGPEITGSDVVDDDFFGDSVAIDGNRVVVGAPSKDGGGTETGSAYVFDASAGGWPELGKIMAETPVANERFGESVAIEGPVVLVGAPDQVSNPATSGSAYVFADFTGSYAQEARLTDSDFMTGDRWGISVAFDFRTALVGGMDHNHNGIGTQNDSGAAMAFLLDITLPNGHTCPSLYPCDSGHCVDGVCCDTACDAGPCDVCSLSAGGLPNQDGTCGPRRPTSAANTVCRGATQPCDVTETCSSSSTVCPADEVEPAGTVCNPAAGACDVEETCNGTAKSCPADALAADGTECRAVAGPCDVAETCTGSSAACPPDGFAPTTNVCRGVAGPCDVEETCTGTSAACPADGFLAATQVCRTAAGDCDVEETCTGASAACPADAFSPATTECRASAGDCDPAERCTGTDADCPADALATATTVCRPPASGCDAEETCTGADVDCPTDAVESMGTVCRASSGTCDVEEVCDGTDPACPTDAFVADGTDCSDGSGCNGVEVCTAGVCGATPVDCDDGDPCTADSCAEPGTCSHEPIAGCCATVADCPDDGDPCTTESCDNGTCASTPVAGCGGSAGAAGGGGVAGTSPGGAPGTGGSAGSATGGTGGVAGSAIGGTGGTAMMPDAGTGEPSGPDSGDSGGCSCTTAGSRTPGAGFWFALMAGGLLWRRRRAG